MRFVLPVQEDWMGSNILEVNRDLMSAGRLHPGSMQEGASITASRPLRHFAKCSQDADQGTIRSVDHIRSLRLPFLAFLDRLGRLSIVKAGDNSKLAPAGRAVNIRNDVRIVDPVTQRVELLPHLHVDQQLSSDTERPFKGKSVSSTSAEPPNAEWKACGWTPCGDMLLGTWRCSEPPFYTWGFALMDQLSLRCIYTDVGSADKMTWASATANGSQGARRMAYFPLLYTNLELLHVNGKWQAEANYLKHVISYGELAHLAPDGGSLVIHAAHTGCLSHLNLKSDARWAVTPSLPWLFREELPPQWAPFPRGWTPAYAHVHDFPKDCVEVLQEQHADLLVDIEEAAANIQMEKSIGRTHIEDHCKLVLSRLCSGRSMELQTCIETTFLLPLHPDLLSNMSMSHATEDEALTRLMAGLVSGACEVDKLSDDAIVKMMPAHSASHHSACRRSGSSSPASRSVPQGVATLCALPPNMRKSDLQGAVDSLARLDSIRCPLEALQRLSEAYQALSLTVRLTRYGHAGEDGGSADELLPLFIAALVLAQPRGVMSLLHYVRTFHVAGDWAGQDGFQLATLEAAISFLMQHLPPELTPPPSSYQDTSECQSFMTEPAPTMSLLEALVPWLLLCVGPSPLWRPSATSPWPAEISMDVRFLLRKMISHLQGYHLCLR
ncbi:hypothetical protein WJX84_011858 [Apatococcus fuscideae]|uniref:VPS9 domain-containing protein n=1 Tax=Apatococcus fuscideae TaxID=2026836 RepID=A0AAW1TFY7_9CHLO